MSREAWAQGPMPHQYRGQPRPPHPGMDSRWQMGPYEFMAPPPRGPPYPPPYRVPPGPPPSQRPLFPQPQPMPPMSSASTPNQQTSVAPQTPSPGQSPSPGQTREKKHSGGGGDEDDEHWRQKRQQRNEEMSSAIERARQRREEEEKKMEAERKAAAAEKLRQLDERARKRDEKVSESDDAESHKSEGRTSRTPSESSEKEGRERSYSREQKFPSAEQQQGKSGSRAVPPRFQNKQAQQPENAMRQPQPQQQPGSPQPHPGQMRPGQGPPPPWGPYPWPPGMPMPFMDPNFPRPPMPMQGLPMYPMRRRNDSHGSGTDSQDNEGRQEPYDRDPRTDPRAWGNYPIPHGHPGQYDGRPPFFDNRMYQEYERNFMDYDRREHDRREREMKQDKINYDEDKEYDAEESEESSKEPERDRPPRIQRDPFDDTPDRDQGDEAWSPPPREEKPKKEERSRKEDHREVKDHDARVPEHDQEHKEKTEKTIRDRGDHRDKDHRRNEEKETFRNKDMAWGHPKQSGSHRGGDYGERFPGSMRSIGHEDGGRHYGKREHPNCPPPITPQQSQQNVPPRSHYTSLKRTASNMSTGSTATERKTESPKELPHAERDSSRQKTSARVYADSVKEKPAKDKQIESKPQKEEENRQKPRDEEKMAREEDREPKEKPPRKEEKPFRDRDERLSREEKTFKEDKQYKEDGPATDDRRERMQPPAKKKRDEAFFNDKYERGDRRGGSSRGREFVRGRGRSAGGRGPRGNYTNRGGRGGSRDNKSYERSGTRSASGRNDRRLYGSGRDRYADDNYYAETEELEAPRRRRMKDEESDHSEQSEFGTSDSSGEAVDKRENMQGYRDKERNKRPPPRENRSGNGSQSDERRGLDDSAHRQSHEESGDPFQRRDDRRHENRMNGRNGSSFEPRGEPSRRGRGGSSVRGRGGRGGGGGRMSSAPPGRGGFGKPPGDKEDWGGGGTYRKENKRPGREPPPPRFAMKKGLNLNEKGRGTDRGRGRGRGRGGSAPPSITTKRPQLIKQNSSDLANDGNEEWETASESSGIFEKNSKNEYKDKERKDSTPGKKSFSSQRPFNDRQNRKGNQDGRRQNGVDYGKNSGKERSPNHLSKNGNGPRASNAGPRKPYSSSKKENVSSVYRVDQMVPNNQNAINNAINNLKSRTGKKSDLTDVSKPLKSEEKRTSALANIDINNYASVVVIDDAPEVTIDDPNFLFDSNEGFQEVTSKKAFKSKQKAQQEAEQRQKLIEIKKSTAKVVAKPKGVGQIGEKPRHGSKSKLPPRLARQREQREREKTKAFDMKIENWDNELANNIPPPSADAVEQSSTEVKNAIEVNSVGSPATMQPMHVSMNGSLSHVSASIPPVSAWVSKPISYAAVTGSVSAQVSAAAVETKFDKGDQHDSGIDVSDQPNSAGSSTRSSPSAENKLKIDKTEDKMPAMTAVENTEVPKPQRQPKGTRSEKVSVKDTMDKPDTSKVVKKPDLVKEKSRSTTSIEKPEPIQLPSFPFGKGDDASELKLDFIYDDALAKFPEKVEPEKEMDMVESNNSVTMPIASTTVDTQSMDTTSPTSPAAQDLNQKIASVKTFWDIDQMQSPSMTVFDQGINTPSLVSAASTASETVSVSDSFSSFQPDMDPNVMVSGETGLDLEPRGDDNNSSLATTLSPREDGLSYSSNSVEVSANMGDNGKSNEQSNVCKVKPQQLQASLGGGDCSSGSSSVLSNPSGVHSPTNLPPILPTASQQAYQAFQIGTSTLITPEPRVQNQPSFGGYGLNQQQQPQLGQTFSQQSLFMPTTPTQPDSYGMPQLSAYTHRNQQAQHQPQHQQHQPQAAFGQNPTPQNTIMVSSATSSLMSTTIKPPQNAYGTTLQKNIGPSSLQFGQQGLSSNLLQPSQPISFFQYDPNQPFGTNQFLGSTQTAQNVNTSQILGSQLVQPRPAVQNVPQVQGSSSFYQQPQQNMQQTSFFSTQPGSNNMQHLGNGNRKSGELMFQACILQGALQQAAAAGAPTAPQFSMQTFGNQSAAAAAAGPSLNLSLQPSGGAQAPMGVAPAQPSSGSKLSQFNPPPQQQPQQGSPQNTPLKSPPQSLGQNTFGVNPSSVSQQQNQGSKLFNLGQLQTPNTNQRFTNVNVSFNNNLHSNISNMKQFGGQKFNPPFMGQPLQSAGPMVRSSMMVNNFRPSAPPTAATFPNPIQRPGGVQIPSSPRQQRPSQVGPPASMSVVSGPGSNNTVKAQQAKQRQELLAHAQSFLNPQNKPSIKLKAEASVNDSKSPPQPTTPVAGSGPSIANPNTNKPEEKSTDKK